MSLAAHSPMRISSVDPDEHVAADASPKKNEKKKVRQSSKVSFPSSPHKKVSPISAASPPPRGDRIEIVAEHDDMYEEEVAPKKVEDGSFMIGRQRKSMFPSWCVCLSSWTWFPCWMFGVVTVFVAVICLSMVVFGRNKKNNPVTSSLGLWSSSYGTGLLMALVISVCATCYSWCVSRRMERMMDELEADWILDDEPQSTKWGLNHFFGAVRQMSSRYVLSGSLLDGFRSGEMEDELRSSSSEDLIDMMPVVCTSIAMLPFGMTKFRKRLCKIFNRKVLSDGKVQQSFLFYLNACRHDVGMTRIWSGHPLMELSRLSVANDLLEERKLDYESSMSVTHSSHHHNLTSKSTHGSGNKQGGFGVGKRKSGSNMADVLESNGYVVEYKSSEAEQLRVDITTTFHGNNAIDFFGTPLMQHAEEGFRVVAGKVKKSSLNKNWESSEPEATFYDPMTGRGNVTQLEVVKIFSSNARPMLIRCFTDGKLMKPTSEFILKRGDDLRKDAAVMAMFRFFNRIWDENRLTYNGNACEALVYKVVPMSVEFGVIEFVSGCQPLKTVSSLQCDARSKGSGAPVCDDAYISRMIATAAGSYIAAFVLGIRDRHDENILIREADGSLFHIDFGYMLGERVSGIDTNKFAITKSFEMLLGNRWAQFVNLATQAWLILRDNAEEIVDYSRVVFHLLYDANEVEAFVVKHLKSMEKDDVARKYIEQKLLKAPNAVKTKVKNAVHSFAQKIRK